jgi:hypothetical protein
MVVDAVFQLKGPEVYLRCECEQLYALLMELIDQIAIEEAKGAAGKRPLTIFDLITKI